MSILSHNHRFLFLHVAKTGGRSVNLTLARHCTRAARFNTKKLDPNVDVLGRQPALEIRRHMTEQQWNNYFKFAFVRNPWDRAVSMFRHIRSSVEMNSPGKIRYLAQITDRLKIEPNEFTFDVFVNAVLRDRIFDNYHWDKQILSLTDESNRVVFDFIGRFESLQSDYDTACRRIGFPLSTLPHHNRTHREHYAGYYTAETRRIVRDVYCEDIDAFKYTFEDSPRHRDHVVRPASMRERTLSRLFFYGREMVRRIKCRRGPTDGLRPGGAEPSLHRLARPAN